MWLWSPVSRKLCGHLPLVRTMFSRVLSFQKSASTTNYLSLDWYGGATQHLLPCPPDPYHHHHHPPEFPLQDKSTTDKRWAGKSAKVVTTKLRVNISWNSLNLSTWFGWIPRLESVAVLNKKRNVFWELLLFIAAHTHTHKHRRTHRVKQTIYLCLNTFFAKYVYTLWHCLDFISLLIHCLVKFSFIL